MFRERDLDRDSETRGAPHARQSHQTAAKLDVPT
jgi:hypothetical protein